MTMENTETTATAPATKTDKDKDKKAKSKSSTQSTSPSAEKVSNPLGLEYTFLPLPPDVAASGVIRIDPRDIAVSKVDARSAPAIVDEEFVASIKKDGLIQDPCVTYARHLKTGKDVWLIVAGRRRREGSIQAGLKQISCKVKEIKDQKEYLILAGQENLKRDQMTAWDKYSFLQNLMQTGYKQSELKDVLSVTEGNVSQILSIGKLDERVQKMVREGTKEPFKSYAPSVVRQLNRIKDNPEIQVAFAQQAIEEKLEPKALEFIVDKWLNKQAAGEEGKKSSAAAKGGRGVKLPDELTSKDIKPVAKTDLVALYNFINTKLAKLKSSDKAKPETVAYEKGRRDGLAQAAGLIELPAKLTEEE